MYYMSIEDLTGLMPSVFTRSELLGVGWSNYTPEDLNAILGRSEGFIDNLKFKGKFKEKYQLHAFPRVLDSGYEVKKDDERVLKALCCVVYDFLKNESMGSSRVDLIKQGVKSISTGGVSESYGDIKDIKIVSDNYVSYLGFCLFNGVL